MQDTRNWESGEERIFKNMIIYSNTSISLPFSLAWVKLYVKVYEIGTGNLHPSDHKEVDIEY